MSVNVVVIAGNLTKDPEVRRTQSGMPIVSFGVAVNDRRKNPQSGQYEDVPNFFDVVAFGDRWEKLAQYMPKGCKVTIQGKLRWSQWERDGQKRSKVEIVAEDVELPPRQRQPAYQGGAYQASTSTNGPVIDIDPVEAMYESDDIPW